MNLLPIKFEISSTDTTVELGIQVWINDLCVHQQSHVTETYQFRHEIDDDEEKSYQLKIVMTGKTVEHTQLDDDGNIVKDAMLSIRNISLDDLNIDKLVHTLATYQHDFNGTQPQCSDEFFGDMGCNGSVVFEFTTPSYLWLLEHM